MSPFLLFRDPISSDRLHGAHSQEVKTKTKAKGAVAVAELAERLSPVPEV